MRRKAAEMKQISAVKKAIGKARRIIIACHKNPDGDALGSLLALGLGLKKIGKRVTMMSVDGIPHAFVQLPGAEDIVRRVFKRHYDLAIAVDCGKKELLEKAYQYFENVNASIEIDHHDFRTPFATMQYVDTNAAAVGEIVYELLLVLKVPLDVNIAENILTSIIVETNSFRLPSVTARTFEICADLVRCGIDFHRITNTIYWARSRNAALLSSLCLSRSVFHYKGMLVWSLITKKDLRRYKAREEDLDACADEMRAIRNVKIAILFREEEGGTLRVSLRSKERINIAALARKYSGGGHYDVAGCIISKAPRVRQRLIAEAKKLLVESYGRKN